VNDVAFKEAIRQSLLEFEDSKEQGKNDQPTEAVADEASNEIPETEGKTPASTKEMTETSEAKQGADDEEEESETKQGEEEEEEFEIPPAAPVGAPPAPRPAEEPYTEEAVVMKAEKVAGSPIQDSERENSFAEDAIGNGPVAEELGKVFDKFVTDMNEFKTNIDGVPEETVDPVKNEKESGATIVQGEEDDEEENEVDAESQNSWDVVDADHLPHDEALARATQVVGSALFESGLSRGESQSGGSQSAHSVPGVVFGDDSSCPTSLPSLGSVQPIQVERWVLQLSQLHELGFLDDVKNVEILERFHAANIGSDEMEEVSVERVVNELMKDF
jgi:hypothetical protein